MIQATESLDRDADGGRAVPPSEAKPTAGVNLALIVSDEPWQPSTIPPRPWIAPPYLMRGERVIGYG